MTFGSFFFTHSVLAVGNFATIIFAHNQGPANSRAKRYLAVGVRGLVFLQLYQLVNWLPIHSQINRSTVYRT